MESINERLTRLEAEVANLHRKVDAKGADVCLRWLEDAVEGFRQEIERGKEKLEQQEATPRLERWKPENGDIIFCYDVPDGVSVKKFASGNIYHKAYIDNFRAFPTREEAEREQLRNYARCKLEWMARELNRQSGLTGYHIIYYIISEGNDFLVMEWREPISGLLGAVYFSRKKDAEYALSKMTPEELEALR